MPSLPPVVKGRLFYDGVWNDITGDLRQTQTITIARGADSEQGTNSPTKVDVLLDNRSGDYSPRNPESPLYGKIGRNTPMDIAIEGGPPFLDIPFQGTFNDSALVALDQPELDFTSDVDIRIDCTSRWWSTLNSFAVLLAERWEATGNNRCWKLVRHATGHLWFGWSTNGSTLVGTGVKSTAVVPFYSDERVAIRVTLDVNNGAGGYTVRFFYSNQIDGEWVELGSPVMTTSGTTSVFNGAGSAPVWLGAPDDASLPDGTGTTVQLYGKIYAYQQRNGIDGPLTVDVDIARDVAVTDTSFTDPTTVLWSLQEDATFSNTYIRISGEVPSWPPSRDLTGNDQNTVVEPTGITRRLDSGNKPLESALLRYLRANEAQPIECWPLTDGAQANGGASITGGQSMSVRIRDETTLIYEIANERYEWTAGAIASWIEPVGVPTSDTDGFITGECRTGQGSDTLWAVDFFFSGINNDGTTFQAVDRTTPTLTDAALIWNIEPNKSSDAIDLIVASVSEGSSSTSLLQHMVAPGIFDKQPHHIRLEVIPGSSPTSYFFYIDGQLISSGNYAADSAPLARIRTNWFLAAGDQDGFPFGFVTYWGSNSPLVEEIYTAFLGFPGDTSGERFQRLVHEQGFTPNPLKLSGSNGELQFQERMGTQGLKRFLELLQECADSDVSIFMEKREESALLIRSKSSMYNQAPRFTLDFTNGVVSAPFKPVDDDKLTENDVVVQRIGGSFSQEVLTEGRMSIQDSPDGVGRYDVVKNRSLFEDEQTIDLAGWYLHAGTFDGLRYTRLTVDLANPRVFEMMPQILNTDLGDIIRIVNLPNQYGPDDVDLMVRGYTEEIGPDIWKITFNCSPGETWRVASVALDVFEGFEDANLDIVVANAGSASWARSSAEAHTGLFSFKSGAIANNQVSDAIITVPPNAERIEFWYKTDSQAAGVGFDGDALIILLDGVEDHRDSGPGGEWTLYGADVSNIAAVTLRYDKDNAGTAGADAVYVDDVRFRITSPNNVNVDTAGSVTTESLTTGETGMDVYSTGLYPWVTSEESFNDFPFDVRVGGEVMRVNSIDHGLFDTFDRSVAATVTDTFTRSVSNAWGSADSGQAWTMTGGAASDYSVNGTKGLMSAGVVNSSRFAALGSVSIADCDMRADFTIPAVATGASISTGLRLRAIDGSNYYYIEAVQATSGNISIQLVSRVASVSTTISGPVSKGAYSAAQVWSIRAIIVGDVLKAKLWLASGSEPDLWDVYAVTTSLPVANPPGLRHILSTGNTNTLPVVATWDNITVTPVSQGWGTSTSGDAWATAGGSASNFYVADGYGVIEMTTVNASRRTLIGPSWVDVDQKMLVQVPIVALTDSIDPGLLARYDSNSDYYLGTLHFHNDATVDARIRKVVGGTFTTMAIGSLLPQSYGPGSRYWIRFRVQGSLLQVKAWHESVEEPKNWELEVVDTSHTDGGDIGIRSNLQVNNTNLLPISVTVADYIVISPQQFSVTRSINGVVKTHSSGADVRLAYPPIIAK